MSWRQFRKIIDVATMLAGAVLFGWMGITGTIPDRFSFSYQARLHHFRRAGNAHRCRAPMGGQAVTWVSKREPIESCEHQDTPHLCEVNYAPVCPGSLWRCECGRLLEAVERVSGEFEMCFRPTEQASYPSPDLQDAAP